MRIAPMALDGTPLSPANAPTRSPALMPAFLPAPTNTRTNPPPEPRSRNSRAPRRNALAAFLGDLFLTAVATGRAMRHLHRGRRDVHHVELAGERRHDGAHIVEVAFREPFAQRHRQLLEATRLQVLDRGNWLHVDLCLVKCSMVRSRRCSRGSARVMAVPTRPARPVRPIR